MIHSAKDLSPGQKTAIESLLGRPVSEQETISIRAFAPAPAVTLERRAQIVDQMNEYFARVDANRQSVSSDEANAALDEAIRSVRPRYRPLR